MTAMDCANYLIYLLNDSCDDLTNVKLNKILFYVQGYSLKQRGVPMFDDAIEAWELGPVVYSVYTMYKNYKDEPIRTWDDKSIEKLSEEDKAFIFDVARTYCIYTASALINITHAPNGVWQKYYNGEKRTEIPVPDIKEFFDKNEKDVKPLSLSFSEEDSIGYRDDEDVLVLPGGWDEKEAV